MKLLRKKLPSPSGTKSLLGNVVRSRKHDDDDDEDDGDDDANPASSPSCPPMCEGEYVPPPGPQSMIRLPSRGKRGGGGDDGSASASASASTSRDSQSRAPHCNTAVHTFSFSDEECAAEPPQAAKRRDENDDDGGGGGDAGGGRIEREGKSKYDDDADEEVRAYGAPVTKSSKTLPSSNRRRSTMLRRGGAAAAAAAGGGKRSPSSLPEEENETAARRCDDDTKVSTLSSNSHSACSPRSTSASASASGSGGWSRASGSGGRRVPLVNMDTEDVSMVRPSLTVSQRKRWLAGAAATAPVVAEGGTARDADDDGGRRSPAATTTTATATNAIPPPRPPTSQSIGEPSYQRRQRRSSSSRAGRNLPVAVDHPLDDDDSSSSDSRSSFSPPPAPPPRDDDDDDSDHAVLVAKDDDHDDDRKFSASARYIFEDDGEYDDETLGETIATRESSARIVVGTEDDGTFATSVTAGCNDDAKVDKDGDKIDDRRSEGTSSVDTDLLSRINLDDDQLMSGSQSPGTLRITPEGLKRHERKQLKNFYNSFQGGETGKHGAGGGSNDLAESIMSGASSKSGMSGYEEWKKRKDLTKMALELNVEEDLDEARLRRRRQRERNAGRGSAKSGASNAKSFVDEEDAAGILAADADASADGDNVTGRPATLSLSDVDCLEDGSGALDSLLGGQPDNSVAMGGSALGGSAISPGASGSFDHAASNRRALRRGSSNSPEKKKKAGGLTAKFQKTIQTVGSNVSSAASSIKHEASSKRDANGQHRRLGSGVTNFSVMPFASMGDDSVSDLMKSGIANKSSSAERDGKGSGGRDMIQTCAQKLLGTKSKAITGGGGSGAEKHVPTAEDLLETERLKHVQERIEKRKAEKKEKRRIEEMKARELARQRRREIEARKERKQNSLRLGGDNDDDWTPLTKNTRERTEDRRTRYSRERRGTNVVMETSALTLEEEGRGRDDPDDPDGGCCGGQGVEVVDTTGLDSLLCSSSSTRVSPGRASSTKSVGSDEKTAKRGSSSNLHRRSGSVGGASSSTGGDARTVAGACAVCNVNERTHLATPCMHFSFCERCVERMRSRLVTRCPVCDAADVVFNKVYF